jgi:bacillithiol biosynthesis deacetylase BshB1
MKLDLLVIAAHPDDAEICVGGTMLRALDAGWKVGIVDVTRGEMGSRGTSTERDAETAAANQHLGLTLRRNLGLPDGRVVSGTEPREALARILREHAPQVVLAQHTEDLHPDHAASGRLAREAWYLSGLSKLAELDGGPAAARPRRFYHFMGHVPFDPTVVVDIGPVWQRKVELVRCYRSQLEPAHEGDRGQHFLFGADILARMETRARFFGERIGVRVGEPLLSLGPIPISDPLRLL